MSKAIELAKKSFDKAKHLAAMYIHWKLLTERKEGMLLGKQLNEAANNHHQALALLAEPEPTEFTNIFSKFLNYPDTAQDPRDYVQWEDMSKEAIHIIASRQAEIGRLKEDLRRIPTLLQTIQNEDNVMKIRSMIIKLREHIDQALSEDK